MRILHVIPTLAQSAGGSREACLSLCRALRSRDQEVVIYTTNFDPAGNDPVCTAEPVELEGVTVRRFPVQRPRAYGFSLPLFNALRRDLASFDIVHIHSLYRFHFVATTILCRLYGIPYLIKPHGSLDPFLFKKGRSGKSVHEALFERPALRRAAAVHFTALEEMTLAVGTGVFGNSVRRNDLRLSNGVIIPEGLERERDGETADRRVFLDQHPELAGKKVILFLSRINFKKGLDLLAKAFAIVCRTRNDVRLVIVGPDDEGYAKQVRGWLDEGGVSDKTIWTGMLTGRTKFAAYKAADVFVLPSYTENFGYVVVEAMSLGVPVVTTNRVNIWREIEAAGAGAIVDCDARQVADAILRLLNDREQAKAMAERGRALARNTFGIDAAASQAMRVYSAILRQSTLHQTPGTLESAN
jgi:glycosyltransferase involved in cell wall biosynthesis